MTVEDLEEIHRLYLLRKKFSDDTLRQGKLDQAAKYFCSLEVDSAVFLMNEVDGILDIGDSSEDEIRIWPNPTKDKLHIQGGKGRFDLLDLSGQSIIQGRYPTQIRLEDRTGLLFVRLFDDNGKTLVIPVMKF